MTFSLLEIQMEGRDSQHEAKNADFSRVQNSLHLSLSLLGSCSLSATIYFELFLIAITPGILACLSASPITICPLGLIKCFLGLVEFLLGLPGPGRVSLADFGHI